MNPKPLLERAPRSLTLAEIEEKKVKGLCFIYDEPYTPRHHLKHKRTELYLMEIGDEDTEEESEAILMHLMYPYTPLLGWLPFRP